MKKVYKAFIYSFSGIAFGVISTIATLPAQAASLFVSNSSAGVVNEYDADTGAFIKSYDPPTGTQVSGVDVYGSKLYVAVRDANMGEVYRFDVATGANEGIFAVDPNPVTFQTDLEFGSGGVAFLGTGDFTVGGPIDAIVAFNPDGSFNQSFADATQNLPSGILYSNGSLYVSSFNNDEVLRYNATTGASLGVFASGNSLDNPAGLAWGPGGDLYVASTGSGEVLRFDGTTGAFEGVAIAAGTGGLEAPVDVAYFENNFYVSSRGTSGQVIGYTAGGSATGFAISGLNNPSFLVAAAVPEPVSTTAILLSAISFGFLGRKAKKG